MIHPNHRRTTLAAVGSSETPDTTQSHIFHNLFPIFNFPDVCSFSITHPPTITRVDIIIIIGQVWKLKNHFPPPSRSARTSLGKLSHVSHPLHRWWRRRRRWWCCNPVKDKCFWVISHVRKNPLFPVSFLLLDRLMKIFRCVVAWKSSEQGRRHRWLLFWRSKCL